MIAAGGESVLLEPAGTGRFTWK